MSILALKTLDYLQHLTDVIRSILTDACVVKEKVEMNFEFKTMDFAFKMLNFVVKMSNLI